MLSLYSIIQLGITLVCEEYSVVHLQLIFALNGINIRGREFLAKLCGMRNIHVVQSFLQSHWLCQCDIRQEY